MAIINRVCGFGIDRCLVCNKKLRADRKYRDFCTVRCFKKWPSELQRVIDGVSTERNG
jgi:hypothetical protein